MKIIKRLVFWAIFLIGIALVIALFLPTQFSVKRSAMIEQPIDNVFQYVKQLKNQEFYSVWWKADPKMKKNYTITALDAKNTRVSWSINGEIPYPTNLTGLFFDMEQTLGEDLEKGLKNLKRILEK